MNVKMGPGGFDEAQTSTSNGKKYKLTRTLFDGCGAVNLASVPKKLRSAIKRQGRVSVTSPLPIPRKQHHVSNGVDTLRKDGTKKSKLNTTQGNITKDEEEVAETLYALSRMFSDAKRLDQEQPVTTSSAILKEESLINATEGDESRKISSAVTLWDGLTIGDESRKIKSAVTLWDGCHSSNLMNLAVRVVKSESLAAQQPEFLSIKEPANPSGCGVQSDLSLASRTPVLAHGMDPRGERGVDLEQVEPCGVQNGKDYNPIEDKFKGIDMFRSPYLSAKRAPNSGTHSSCPRSFSARLPAWLEGSQSSSQPNAIDSSINTEKYTKVESKKSWKRCCAHVYISRLIKELQISDREELLTEKPTQLTPCGGAELQQHVCPQRQRMVINCQKSGASSSGINSSAQKDSPEIRNDIVLHKRMIQDQQMISETASAKHGYDFLSLGTGICGLETGESVERAGCNHEPPKQYRVSYMHSQDHSAMLFPVPQNGYSSSFLSHNSALAAQQVHLPQYHSRFMAQTGQLSEPPHQQKWTSQLQTHYNTGGGRDSASVLNYAHAIFPHLNAALGSKYQQYSPSQQQFLALNTSPLLPNMKRPRHHLAVGFERNGSSTFCAENIQQLQLPCNQHL